MATYQNLKLIPAADRAKRWLLVLGFGLPVLITVIALGVAFLSSTLPKTFGANNVAISALAILLLSAAATGTLWYFLNRAMARHELTLEKDFITVNTSFYSQRLAKSDLLIESAALVDIGGKSAYRPIIKTNGYALPGFASGWFRLRNREKAFCAIAEVSKVVLIPTKKGHVLLLGIANPDSAIQALKSWANTA